MSRLHNMKHDKDPKEVILEQVGEIPSDIVSGIQVLVATYERPKKTMGGIVLTDKTAEEDQYQGKCGLVIALGPLAFSDTAKYKFGGFAAKIGDWVWYRPQDGAAMSLNTGNGPKHCRSVDDNDIRGKLPHPDFIL